MGNTRTHTRTRGSHTQACKQTPALADHMDGHRQAVTATAAALVLCVSF